MATPRSREKTRIQVMKVVSNFDAMIKKNRERRVALIEKQEAADMIARNIEDVKQSIGKKSELE